jgi:hypothetical protein
MGLDGSHTAVRKELFKVSEQGGGVRWRMRERQLYFLSYIAFGCWIKKLLDPQLGFGGLHGNAIMQLSV